MPTFFAENPRQWFQTAEAQFATARPTPNNGQKYFHLLQINTEFREISRNFEELNSTKYRITQRVKNCPSFHTCRPIFIKLLSPGNFKGAVRLKKEFVGQIYFCPEMGTSQ
jgi:hypothetical protein